MSNLNNIIVIDDAGPRPQTVREMLHDLTGRPMNSRTFALVDHIREIAVARGEYGDHDVYCAFKRLEDAKQACEMAEWHRKMARSIIHNLVIR